MKIPELPLVGRLRHFKKNWKKLTQDKEILKIVGGYEIPFSQEPIQKTAP